MQYFGSPPPPPHTHTMHNVVCQHTIPAECGDDVLWHGSNSLGQITSVNERHALLLRSWLI